MKRKLKLKLLCVLGAIFVFVSCDRNFEFNTISITDPSLEVLVEGLPVNNVYPKIDGATVQLFDSDGELLASKITDISGKVIFNKQDLRKEGVFTVVAVKDGLTGTGKTSYMLLNDGITLLIVKIS